MATNMTFVDYVTPVPADWLNFVNAFVNNPQASLKTVSSIAALRTTSKTSVAAVLVEGYYTAGDLGGGWYWYNATDTTSADNGGTIIVGGDGGRWYLKQTGWIFPQQFGAKGDGVNDDAAVFRNMIAAGVVDYYFPPGNYLFASSVAVPPGLPAFDPANVMFQGINNFKVVCHPGAVFTTSNTANLTGMITIYNCQNWSWSGGVFNGNRTGLTPSQENGAFALQSVVNFTIEKCVFNNWPDEGVAMYGDWMVNGTFKDLIGTALGVGFDFAFLNQIVFENINFWGRSGTNSTGDRGISCIYDVIQAGSNVTGIGFSNSQQVYVRGCNLYNFTSGVYFATGTGIFINDNELSNNPGRTPGIGGYGILLDYFNGGGFSSVGFPVNQVYISNNTCNLNGGVVAGAGILLNSGAITNSDLISNIFIQDNTFIGNNGYGVNTTGASHLANIVVQNNNFSGNTTNAIGVPVYSNLVNGTSPRNGLVTDNFGFNPFGQFFVGLPAGTGAGNAQTNTTCFPVDVTVFTSSSAYTINIIYPAGLGGGTVVFGATAANSAPVTFTLPPGCSVYFTTNLPSGWQWVGA